MKTVIVKVNNTTQIIAEHQLITQDGQPTVIQATKKVNYELIDQATGHAPDHLITKRVGKDLHVSVEEDGQESDLIIEGYYDDVDSALIGMAEDGSYYYYVPDTGEVADYVTELAPGDIEGQALGGNAYQTPYWVGAAEEGGFAWLPWLVGLAGVGALIAALDDDDDDDSAPPDQGPGDAIPNLNEAPVIKIPEAVDGINNEELSDGVQTEVSIPEGTQVGDKLTITVTDPNNKTKTVEHIVTQEDITQGVANITIGKDKIPEDGTYTAQAKITGDNGNNSETSEPVDFIVDSTVPGDVDGDSDPSTGDADGDGKDDTTGGDTTDTDTNTLNGGPRITFLEDTMGKKDAAGNDISDGYLNASENLADGDPDTTSVHISIPEGAQAGDTLY
ncbi:hypothetical protein, partial [Psychrobacter lutiphocae]|uniref:hypothetical protein n=1 Tax=Psychrobacter lutiphocae TaxID=540500 RepID=UPI00036FB18E